MAKFTIEFNIDDDQLERSVKFLKAKPIDVEPIILEYFSGKKKLKMQEIPDEAEKFYHSNGLCAMILCITEAITNNKNKNNGS